MPGGWWHRNAVPICAARREEKIDGVHPSGGWMHVAEKHRPKWQVVEGLILSLWKGTLPYQALTKTNAK